MPTCVFACLFWGVTAFTGFRHKNVIVSLSIPVDTLCCTITAVLYLLALPTLLCCLAFRDFALVENSIGFGVHGWCLEHFRPDPHLRQSAFCF